MSWFRTYLMGVVSAAMVVALAQALTPEGAVKKIGRLVGGIVLLLGCYLIYALVHPEKF